MHRHVLTTASNTVYRRTLCRFMSDQGRLSKSHKHRANFAPANQFRGLWNCTITSALPWRHHIRYPHQLEPIRSFASRKGKNRHPSSSNDNPFKVLGIPVGSNYTQIRQAFVKLALEHHPDRASQSDSTTDSSSSVETFIRIRQAFEELTTNEDGTTTTVVGWTQEEIRDWYEHETGESLLQFEMTEQTRREVIHAYKTLSRGGNDKGGYWEMARQLTERHEAASQSDRPPIAKQLTGGTDGKIGTTRRRRKR